MTEEVTDFQDPVYTNTFLKNEIRTIFVRTVFSRRVFLLRKNARH